MKPYLLDVNLLIALFDPAHINHDSAHKWFARINGAQWATCPLTENGFVRIVSHPSYPDTKVKPNEALEYLSAFVNSRSDHVFWDDEISLRDTDIFDRRFILRSEQITDFYLLGLAVKKSGKLATFDRRIDPRVVRLKKEEILEEVE